MNSFEHVVTDYINTSKSNYISEKDAIDVSYINKRMFDEPLFAYGDVGDPLFEGLHQVIGKHYRAPEDWNEKGKTVVSIFLPFTEEIRTSNICDVNVPSALWLHGRIEGQKFISELTKYAETYLNEKGFMSVAPSVSKDFFAVEQGEDISFTSNWSERHTAYICGLGTFGLSKGIITKKGMAGRLTSIITEADFEKTTREYSQIYEYCTRCGACIKRCPVNAISLEKGKEHIPCSLFLGKTRAEFAPRYGCGKCQVSVPCSDKIPVKN